MTEKKKPTGLALLREPFPANQISKLPKPTKAQTEAVRNDFKQGVRCPVCGGWHHPKVVHLDYVGHAALTDRLLDCDPEWNWEPVAFDEQGRPAIDENGGMWIKLTVCGVTRLGYGHPDGKRGGDAVKETIGDALRNAAMRFGAALDLWHKGDLHADYEDAGVSGEGQEDEPPFNAVEAADRIKDRLRGAASLDALGSVWRKNQATLHQIKEVDAALEAQIVALKDQRKADLTTESVGGDEIPFQGAAE